MRYYPAPAGQWPETLAPVARTLQTDPPTARAPPRRMESTTDREVVAVLPPVERMFRVHRSPQKHLLTPLTHGSDDGGLEEPSLCSPTPLLSARPRWPRPIAPLLRYILQG